jgi:hypothetical protein
VIPLDCAPRWFSKDSPIPVGPFYFWQVFRPSLYKVAFGIPMHKDVTCENCRKTFSVDGSHSPEVDEGDFSATCPYCQHPNVIKWPLGGIPLVNPK